MTRHLIRVQQPVLTRRDAGSGHLEVVAGAICLFSVRALEVLANTDPECASVPTSPRKVGSAFCVKCWRELTNVLRSHQAYGRRYLHQLHHHHR